jgi:nitrilase
MAPRTSQPFRVAVVQAAPVYLDLDATVEKACSLVAEAGRAGAKLALFPECFVPAYPIWCWFIPAGRTRDLRALYTELVANSVTIPGEATTRLAAAARDAGVNVAIGVNEANAEASGATLHNTLLLIDSDGEIRGRHRKLVPTAGERLIHGRGDGSTLEVHDLSIGRVGGLICWENYMPLARYTLYCQGVQIYLAPTWDHGEPWISTLRHIAKESRAYVLGCCSPVRRDDIPDRLPFKQEFLPDREWLNPGESAIVDPDGKFLVEPVAREEKILYGDIDPAAFLGPRFQLDVAGHYARPDIFELAVRCDSNRLLVPLELDDAAGSTGDEAPPPE